MSKRYSADRCADHHDRPLLAPSLRGQNNPPRGFGLPTPAQTPSPTSMYSPPPPKCTRPCAHVWRRGTWHPTHTAAHCQTSPPQLHQLSMARVARVNIIRPPLRAAAAGSRMATPTLPPKCHGVQAFFKQSCRVAAYTPTRHRTTRLRHSTASCRPSPHQCHACSY